MHFSKGLVRPGTASYTGTLQRKIMYIVLIALAYLWFMMLITAPSIGKAILVLIVGGGLLALAYYILNTPTRLRRARQLEREQDTPATPADE